MLIGLEAQAEIIYRSILLEKPTYPDALHLLGLFFNVWMNELYWCSSPIIILIIIITYNHHYTSSLQGVIFYQKGDSLSAIPYIEKALLSNNSHEGFHNSLGQYLLLLLLLSLLHWWWWWWWWWWYLLQWWW